MASGLDKTEIDNIVSRAIEDAMEFVDGDISQARQRAKSYFDGKTKLKEEDGRSKVVATKCRDTVRAVKPALMRVFLQSGQPVEFEPTRPETVESAEQATNYAGYIFRKNNGFQLLSDVFHDALVFKAGIAKVYFDERESVEIDEYTGLTEEQVIEIQSQPGVEITEVTEENGLFNVTASKTDSNGEIVAESIPPEDFFVDSEATSIRDFYVCGNKAVYRVGDLVDMGIDQEKAMSLAGSYDDALEDEEEYLRGKREGADETADPSMRKVLLTEAYMRMDIKGTGVPRMYKFICGGKKHEVLEYELCDFVPYCIFEVDPEPHAFFGRSLVEIIEDDQDAATSLLRGLLDNIASMNVPRVAFDENSVNVDDMQNNEIGAMIRVNGAPNGSVMEFTTGSSGTVAMPAIQYYDDAIRTKTGVTGAGMGMDADALQSQTAAGVNAAVQAASAVSELIARTLAEGGMREMFDLIAKLAHANPDRDEMMRVNGEFVQVDPTSWGAGLDLKTNVGLGHNKHEERIATLSYVIELQMQALQTYGPGNGLVSLTNIRNAVADRARMGGLHDVDKYFQRMNPQIEAQMMQQQAAAAAQQQQGSDPNQAYMQVEQMKAQMKAQTDMSKAQIEREEKMREFALKVAELRGKNDLERDKMLQDLEIQAAEVLGKYDIQLDGNQIKREQAANNVAGQFNG